MTEKSKKHVVRILLVVVVAAAFATLMVTVVPAQSAGMVSHWKFDEGSGATAYDSIGENHGTVSGAIWTTGQVGQALSFDGSDDGVVIADSVCFDIADFTLAAWIKTTDAGSGRRRIISQQHPSPDQFWAMTLFNNQLEACSKTSNGVSDLGASCVAFTGWSLNDGQFHHVAITRKAGVEVKWYIDGVNVKTQATTNTWAFAIAADVFIGKLDPVVEAFYSVNESFSGLIDEVEFYNRALTAEEIQQRYQGYALPIAVAGTSLDGNSMLQLDGTLSSDPQNDPLTFSWQIEGETAPRTGQIVSIADLPVGNYQVTLAVDDGVHTDTDTMLFGIPEGAGVPLPPINELQQQAQNIKDKISSYSTSSFDAPNDTAAENRRGALLNMLDKVLEHIDAADYQAAIDQLQDVLAKSDGVFPPDSPPDWVVDDPLTGDTYEQQEVAQLVSDLIGDLEALL